MNASDPRLFFAAEVGDKAAGEARVLAADLADRDRDDAVRWIPHENYHITLRFLGETAVTEIPQLVAEVSRESASQETFSATLGSLLLLPSPRRVRLITLVVESEGKLERLAACVERGVQRAGVAPEERRFRPHLTLGRTRRGRRYREVALAPQRALATPFVVDAALLVESELSRSGARYRAVERIALGATTHPH